MVKRNFLPSQPLSAAIPEVRRGPSRFLQATSDRSRGSQSPSSDAALVARGFVPQPQPFTRRRLLPGPAATTPLHGYVSRHIIAPGPGLPDPPLSHYLAQYLRPISSEDSTAAGGSRLWAGLRTMAPASMPWTAVQGLTRDLPETALDPTSHHPTPRSPAAPLTCAVVWPREVVYGGVNHPHIDSMQEVRGSCLLSSTTRSRVRCARCVPAALTGDRGLTAKLQVSRPTRDRAPGPSQGGSAGSNPVGATRARDKPTWPGSGAAWPRSP
jgi:hypothetical protein